MSKPAFMTAPVAGELAELANFTCDLAALAATITRAHFRQPLEVIAKADSSPVTIADRECEAKIRAAITARYPAHGILGEEHGFDGEERADIWVIDPIDGTKSFVSGFPLYGTLLAYVREGSAEIGAISMPELNEFWIGVKGKGCYFNGAPCRTSNRTRLDEATLMTTSLEYFTPAQQVKFDDLVKATRIRRYSGDCYIYALVAAGFADLAVDAGLQSYDYMALIPVVEEAGGVITDWSGRRPDINSDGTLIAAATKELHAAALARLAG